ncbi:ArsR/SmtB family transcription factor [Pseudoxanthobacter soli]|nr:metalloregulator ArsR/SmtB family transcription factor [Pseudoxanthobacter soli]
MSFAAEAASEFLKSLANRHRLLILCRLVEGECSVGQLADFLDLRDSTVSQHLALLRKDGLVRGRRDGQTIWYSVASEPARRVLEVLYDVYCAAPPVQDPTPEAGGAATPETASSGPA